MVCRDQVKAVELYREALLAMRDESVDSSTKPLTGDVQTVQFKLLDARSYIKMKSVEAELI